MCNFSNPACDEKAARIPEMSDTHKTMVFSVFNAFLISFLFCHKITNNDDNDCDDDVDGVEGS